MSFAAIVSLALASSTQAQTLWENTKVGMTKEAVRKAQPSVLEGQEYYCALKIPSRRVGGFPMDVCFGFPRDGGLRNVVLTQEGMGAYPDLLKALTAKYGAPTIPESCKGGLISSCVVGWTKGGVSIELKKWDGTDTFLKYEAVDSEGI